MANILVYFAILLSAVLLTLVLFIGLNKIELI
uniref:Cytochrome b6-f complex subunit 6 n=1 Tax=Coleochaete scutata TaxID=3125 RepID=A0A191T5K2_COLSC|nr:subunit VI of cytochrome b6/f complex [Coleochaete scutata]ANI25673.1 subunit VI of cytochrome b6/f complex [Coleochaete scutata]